jgi:Raf kinase inhibitor-like YbhB/YbcL family protein
LFVGVGLLTGAGTTRRAPTLSISSSAFQAGGAIPAEYTCDGDNISPPLSWSGVPSGTRSLALIVDDPDAPDPKAPTTTWVHWVLYDIPPSATGLPRAMDKGSLPEGTRQGTSSFERTGYGGPCPPVGRHRYFFKLYALDTVLPDLHEPDKARLLSAMRGHIIGQAELIGTYQRSKH